MKAAEPGMYEYEIEAIIEYIFRKNGSQRPGFPSIVGSGPNSTILHYDANKHQTQDGDLIVMDVGAEYDHYTADVTRTIPVNGKFNKEQKEIYEIVLEAQQQAIDKIAPGVGIYEVHYRAVEVIKDGLYRLGLITDKESRWQYRIWLMYNTNHWLGLDVHDVGSRGRDDGKGRRLEPGMVFTVEPGIYIGEHSLDSLLKTTRRSKARKEDVAAFLEKVKPVVEKYMNIGVRIEDDVLVTEDGHENLSSKAPTTVKEIEKWMKKKSYLNK
jgi:Xaa-Pro aminopeptidase